MKCIVHFLIILLSGSNILFASTVLKNIYGNSVSWDPVETTSITYYINLDNNGEMRSSDILLIVEEAINEWNKISRIPLKLIETSDGPQEDRNDIYFSSSSLYFSDDSIVAITQASTSKDGSIKEVDIIINGNTFPFFERKNKK